MKLINIQDNEKIKSKYNYADSMDYSDAKFIKIDINNYYSIYYTNNKGNCKVCTLINLQDCLEVEFDKTINRIKELFENVNKLVFNCTFNNDVIIKKLSEHFDLVYKVKVPIGYGSNNQYHCSFISSGNYDSKEYYIKRINEILN